LKDSEVCSWLRVDLYIDMSPVLRQQIVWRVIKSGKLLNRLISSVGLKKIVLEVNRKFDDGCQISTSYYNGHKLEVSIIVYSLYFVLVLALIFSTVLTIQNHWK